TNFLVMIAELDFPALPAIIVIFLLFIVIPAMAISQTRVYMLLSGEEFDTIPEETRSYSWASENGGS
ncbi:MAG: hypothetical protein ACFE7R_03680, partial [Candidatus Hodarchaeota archaeon]